jgi:hypothetical protein
MPSQSASRKARNERIAEMQKQQQSAERRRKLLWWVIGVIGVAAIAVPTAITVVNSNKTDKPSHPGPVPTLDINTAATKLDTGEPLTTSTTPWNLPSDEKPYISAAGLQLAPEMLQVHYHAHLDISADGTNVPVPTNLGITPEGLAYVHTHDDSGVIHIESPTDTKFTLGQAFTEWGVRLTPDCMGGYCTNQDKVFKVLVDGKPYTGNPQDLVLNSLQEIALWYGDKTATPDVPDSFDFKGHSLTA